MKIAFFHELHFGGAKRVVDEYANVFQKHHEIHLFYVGEKEKIENHQFKTSNFYRFSFKNYSGGNSLLKLYKDLIEPAKLYYLHKKIAKEINSKKYDFVFVHPSQFTHAPFILKFLKKKTVYFCHEPLRIAHDPLVKNQTGAGIKKYYENFSRFLKKEIDSSNIRKADLVLANSDFSRKNIKKAYGIDAKICYLGVNPRVFRPLNLQEIYDVIFVGEEVWVEGIDTLREIEKLYPERLKIRIVKKENGEYISDQKLSEEYNKSKVLLALGRSDPFSMIPWEAMACGVPSIVVNEGGPREAVKDRKTGYLVRRDPKEIKKILDELLNDRELREKIGVFGREDVLNNWTWEKSYERFMNIVGKSL